jgi:hypothetical protein
VRLLWLRMLLLLLFCIVAAVYRDALRTFLWL